CTRATPGVPAAAVKIRHSGQRSSKPTQRALVAAGSGSMMANLMVSGEMVIGIVIEPLISACD
ncbi:MAG: hypothetical protein GY845_22310, partial [Planctomycetes bacterium]|nr:hypothetical protein [Planctomycetota bacterium]